MFIFYTYYLCVSFMLTPKQKEVLTFIQNYFNENNYSPTLEEIAKKLNRSVSTIHQFIKMLVEKGYLEQNGSSARNIQPTTDILHTKTKYKIGIIGYGFVGQAVEYGFSNHEIHIYDKFKDFGRLEDAVKLSEYIFLCLPTPIMEDESGIDLTIINASID